MIQAWHMRLWSTALWLSVLVLFVFVPAVGQAATGINKVIYYQGRLQDSGGSDVADGSYNMVFVVYDASSGGTCQWVSKGTCGTPTNLSVTVTDGLFTVPLGDTSVGGGSQNAMAETLFDDDTRYLEVRVEGETLSPRKAIAAAAYAFNANHLQGAAGSSYLRSDTSDSFTSGTLTLDSGTTIDINGDLAVADTSVAFDGASINFATTGDWSINTSQLKVLQASGYVGVGDASPDYALEVSGSQPGFALSSSDVAHGVTSVLQTDSYFLVQPEGTVSGGGGALVLGVSDHASQMALSLVGALGVTDPTDTTPAVIIQGVKKSGTGPAALANAETVLSVMNFTSALATVTGNGFLGLGDTTPDAPLDIATANSTPMTLGGSQAIPGVIAQQTLSLSANSDIPIGLLVNPTFSDGAFTSTVHAGVYSFTNYDGGFWNIFQNLSTNANAWSGVVVMNSGTGSFSARMYSTGHVLANAAHLYGTHDVYLQYGLTDTTKDFYLTSGSGLAATDISLTATDTNYIGIGDTSPDYLLELGSASTSAAPVLALSDSNVSVTRTGYQTDLFGALTINSTTDGGLFIEGLSDTDATGLQLTSYVGAADPTDTIPAIILKAVKKNVASTQAMAAAETVLQIKNNTTDLLTVLGSGFAGVGDSTPDYLLEVSAAAAADPTIALSDGDVAHGITDAGQTDVFGMLRVIDSTAGGMDVVGLSDDDVSGIGVSGVIGAENPTDSTPAIELFGMKKSGTGMQALAAAETVFQLTNNTTPLLAILGNGRTGIGDTTPSYQLEVFVDEASYVANFFNDGNNANRYGLRVQAGADDGSGTTYYLDAYDGDGTQVGYLANTAGTFAVTDPSDVRTKTNIVDTTWDGLGVVSGLRVVDYNRLQDPDGPRLTGFIAQEAQAVFPNMVNVGPTGMLGVAKDALIPILVRAVQQQQEQLSALQVGRALQGDLTRHASGGALTVTDTFTGSITVAGAAAFGGDAVGQARFLPSATRVHISFTQPYEFQPIVTVTPVGIYAGHYGVENTNNRGFDIILDTISTDPVLMNWHAFGANGGKVFVSNGVTEDITLVVSDDQTLEGEEVSGGELQGSEEAAPESAPEEPAAEESQEQETEEVVADDESPEIVGEGESEQPAEQQGGSDQDAPDESDQTTTEENNPSSL